MEWFGGAGAVGDLQGVGGSGGGPRVRLEEAGVGWGTRGEKKKSYGKHLANGLKHADNTTEIKEEAETRRPLLKQMAADAFGSSSPVELTQKARTASFICWGKVFSVQV